MPELPEMETYKNLLLTRLVNQTISDVVINREKSINVAPDKFKDMVIHKKIVSITRRGKYLIFDLGTGYNLLLHLMLGGLMYIGNDNDNPDRTKQIILSFGNTNLYFIGLRLGYLHLLTLQQVEEELSKLGIDPLSKEYSLETFRKVIRNKKGALKTTLQNQHLFPGIGNCYSDEICYEAKILPTRKMFELSTQEQSQLYEAIQTVLKDAIQHGGYIEMPLFHNDTHTGGYDNRCMVYDCEGKSCKRCGSKIIKEIISSKKTFYCANCQI